MNFLYSFAQAGMESDDEEVFKRGLEIVGWGTDIFPQKSLSEKNYVKSIFSGDRVLMPFLAQYFKKARKAIT